jgi:hypothetical protein
MMNRGIVHALDGICDRSYNREIWHRIFAKPKTKAVIFVLRYLALRVRPFYENTLKKII